MSVTKRNGIRRSTMRSLILSLASVTLLIAGSAALGYAACVLAAAKNYQAREIREFESAKKSFVPKLARAAPAEGGVIGEIQISRLQLKAVIVEGDSPYILGRAVGHIPGTPLPGEIGNVALAGHRDTLFRQLRMIRPGDVISLETPNGNFLYRVRSFAVIAPTDVGVLQPTGGQELTLVTCYPFRYIGPAPNRFIVRAEEASQSH